VKHAY